MPIQLHAMILAVALTFGFTAAAQKPQQAEALLQKAAQKETVDGDLKAALELYKQAVTAAGNNRAVAAKALVQMGECYEKQGNTEAEKAYQQVITSYADQAEAVARARARLVALGGAVPASGAVIRRVLKNDAYDPGGALSPDGRFMAYVEGVDLMLFETGTGKKRPITAFGTGTERGYMGYRAAFSRDGREIAYLSTTDAGTSELRVRSLDGSSVRTVKQDTSVIQPFDWSPEGRSILALRVSGDKQDLVLISAADGSARVLRSVSARDPKFSPDGRYIAYTRSVSGSASNYDLFVLTADGREEVAIVPHQGDERLLGWTPDGAGLLFMSDRSGTRDAWSVRVAGGKQQGQPELVKKDFGDGEVFGFAPDGTCYYTSRVSLGRLYMGTIDLETGKLVSAPAAATTRYTSPPSQLSWSPDGGHLLYVSRRGPAIRGMNILTIRSAATGEERFLPPLEFVNQISWAPDGRSIIALAYTETDRGLFRIDAGTGVALKLAGSDRFSPRLAPDGRTLFFVVTGPVIRRLDLDTSAESEVVKVGSMFFDVSPDGREVVFQVKGVVKIVSVSGGNERELFSGPASTSYRLNWTRDGRYIIAQATSSGGSDIWRIPVRGGTPLKLEIPVPKMEFFALHPDNRRFAYGVTEENRTDLWALPNLLHGSRATR